MCPYMGWSPPEADNRRISDSSLRVSTEILPLHSVQGQNDINPPPPSFKAKGATHVAREAR